MAENLSHETPLAAPAKPEADGNQNVIALLSSVSRYIALLVAWVATCGSLFFSEVLQWTPCVLCWYQRILMYPLSIVLAVGLLRRDSSMHTYVLPFSLLGACVSLYHYLLQKTDWLPPPACTIGVPCNVDYINLLGFITIPFLALSAFLIISLTVAASALLNSDEDDEDEDVAEDEDDAEAPESARLGMDQAMVFIVITFVLLSFIAAAKLL